MILKPDLKCILLVIYLEVVQSAIIVIELRAPRIETSEERKPNDVLLTKKVAWVKRIVPENYKSPKYEYDSKFKTIFAPKYRIHKRKPSNKDESNRNLDQVLLEPFKPYKPDWDLVNILGSKSEGKGKLLTELRHGDASAPHITHDDTAPHEHKPFNFPHYSIWSYWTYQKNLLHDECPGQQVKVGTLCVWAPPHRK